MHPFRVERLTKRPLSSVQALPLETIPAGERISSAASISSKALVCIEGEIYKLYNQRVPLKELLVVVRVGSVENKRQTRATTCVHNSKS